VDLENPADPATTDSVRVTAAGGETDGGAAGDDGAAGRRPAAATGKAAPGDADAARDGARAEVSFKMPEGEREPAADDAAPAVKVAGPGAERGADTSPPAEGGRGAATIPQGEHTGATEAAGRPGTATAESATPGAVRSEGSALREGQWNQLVEKAVFSARNGISEARIDLKPDHLGQVRLQILTENAQVSIRIVAETAGARDLLESHLQSLRQELQQQGLQVESFDVTLADDHRSPERRWQAAGYGAQRRRLGAVDGAAAVSAAGGKASAGSAPRGAGAIDYFV
jgi:hypothetical protein